MRIVIDRPPLFDQIDARFGVAGKPVVFAWGDRIYNPMGVSIPAELLAHEAVHGAQQGDDIEGWWRRYCNDDAFRLDQEIPAHQAEYRAFCERPGRDRRARRLFLRAIAKRLSSPLYGRLISFEKARKAIAA